MKKQQILPYLQLLLAPILIIALGLLLLIHPDSASVVISRIIGGLMVLMAVGFGIAAVLGEHRTGKIILAFCLFLGGSVLARNPLLLASFAGRVVGILLLIDGLHDIMAARRNGVRSLFSVIVAAVGLILILMPMTASRLVFSLCGLVALIAGVLMLLDRLRRHRLPGGDNDDNIIDAL